MTVVRPCSVAGHRSKLAVPARLFGFQHHMTMLVML